MDGAMYGLQLPFPIILISLIGQLGSAARPVVTFNPDWNKIHIGQYTTMTCNMEPPASLYYWYRNNNELFTKQKVLAFYAGPEHSGNYKCRTSTGGTSEIVTLSVINGPVILQAPLYIYEGDNISLQCYSPSRSLATQTIFYRNNRTIQKSTTNDTLQLKSTDLKDTYKCAKQFLLTAISRTYSAETTISYTENSRTVPVTFTPDWSKLLTGDDITMTCHGGNNVTYQWLQNGTLVAEGQIYTITSAQVGHSGIYQCRTSHGDSLPFSLEVSDGPLILQAPIFVYWGRDINIKCHSRPEYSARGITLYKNNDFIYGHLHDFSISFHNGNIDYSGRYRCEQELSRDEYITHTDEVSLHVRDLFSKPNITTMLYPKTEGDNMTLICDTSLSPIRQGTELQFAFYRDGREVQKFSSSRQYEVKSAQPKDSGNYSCEVRTPTNSVIKRSEEFYIQIQGSSFDNATLIRDTGLIILAILLITIIVIIVVIKYRRKPSPTSTRATMDPPDAESSKGLSQEGDAYYAKVNFKNKEPATNSNADEDLCYANLKTGQKAPSPRATENQVVYSEIKARTKT
ncbi:Fc receptor-like protein 5 isoform X2 [Rana temporaria]|uniref:Fc receptor-like protein 5 isoform X2 n=1 Tax=Rana temporaria TaxID=8407 RepID=UPI001AAD770E|nr:Fc receptor-like protein 5 isoform X2 [Rana temporaria]